MSKRSNHSNPEKLYKEDETFVKDKVTNTQKEIRDPKEKDYEDNLPKTHMTQIRDVDK